MNNLKKAIEIVKNGGIIIFPTDTAFGIGCRIDIKDAVKRVFEIRKRPHTQAVPVLVSSLGMAERYWHEPVSDIIRKLVKSYWPGGLTIIYDASLKSVPNLVRGGGKTVGLRMPRNDELLTLIKAIDVPILGPSANFHGLPTPFTTDDLDPALIKKVDFVLSGESISKTPSTVIDCSVKPAKILRQGAVDVKL